MSKKDKAQLITCWSCKMPIDNPEDVNRTHFCPRCNSEYTLGRIPSYGYFTSKVFKPCWIKRGDKNVTN